MPVKAVQQRQTFDDLVAAKRREQTMANQALIRPVTAPAPQHYAHAAGIPTRGVASPKLKYGSAVSTYANHTVASSSKGSKAIADSSKATSVLSSPRSRSRTSHSSNDPYSMAHDFFAGTTASNAKAVSNEELQEKMHRAGLGVPAHTTLYGLDHDQRGLLHEHRTDSHAYHPTLVKRIEDVSHLILDAPPSMVNSSVTSSAPLVSSVRKAHSLQTQLHPSDVGLTGPAPAPQDRLVSYGGDVVPARRHGNTVVSPAGSPAKGDLFSKFTQEREDRMCIRTYERPRTSLFGSEDPQPARHLKKSIAVDEATASQLLIQEQLQRQLIELKMREKAAKKAKGAVVALPLNVTSPQEQPTRRHNMNRYMTHELAVGRTAYDVDPTINPFQPSPRSPSSKDPASKPAAGIRVNVGHLSDCSTTMKDIASLALGAGDLSVPVKIKRVGNISNAVSDKEASPDRLHWHMRKGKGSSPQNKARNQVDSIQTSKSGVFASSTADDEIFRADKQHLPSSNRNFSSFHTEEGGPIVHMSRPPTSDSVGLRHAHADAVVRSSLAITEYGISNTQSERPDGGRKMIPGTSFRDSHILCSASGMQGAENSALNELGWSQFAVGRRGVKERQSSGPVPPFGIDSDLATQPASPSRNINAPKSTPFVLQMPAGRAKSTLADEQKLCRYEGRELISGKRRSYPEHPAVAHVSHIQHVTNALPEATAKAAPSSDEIPYARGGPVRPSSHRYFREPTVTRTKASVQPSWWG